MIVEGREAGHDLLSYLCNKKAAGMVKGEKVCIFVLVCGVVETVLFREGEVGVNQERERAVVVCSKQSLL